MDSARVVIVMLRQPYVNDPNEMRTDPLWEFGSFGCTGCHRTNLMHPKKLTEHNGACFAFAQNGPLGIKLVHVTSPVRTRQHGTFCEVVWEPAEMPIRYDAAPTLVNNLGESDMPALLAMIRDVRRKSPVAKFASKFRSRRQTLPNQVASELMKVYENHRFDHAAISQNYVDALPYNPPKIDKNRESTYRRLLGFA